MKNTEKMMMKCDFLLHKKGNEREERNEMKEMNEKRKKRKKRKYRGNHESDSYYVAKLIRSKQITNADRLLRSIGVCY